MENRAPASDLSQQIFSLPFLKDSAPFDLSEAERKLRPDDWAWFFLRLNPLYRHDYALWKNQTTRREEMPARYRLNAPVVPLAPGVPATPVAEDLRALDSRFFTLHGDPLGGRLDEWVYKSETLGAYLDQHPEVDLKAIRIREFDAPRDYGIGAWLAPATLHPPVLPNAPATGRGSWFYHLNEPIYEVHSVRTMQAKLLLHELPDGQTIAFGRGHYTRPRTAPLDDQRGDKAEDKSEQAQVRSIPLLPTSIDSKLAATQFRFLVCLDGYVRPQVATAFQLASELRELLKEDDANFKSSSTPARPTVVEEPLTPTRRLSGLFNGLTTAAVRIRKHWCAVTIDLVGPLGGQQEKMEAVLLKKQEALVDELTFPIRMRSPNEKDAFDNPLKRALCVVELRRHGDAQREGRPTMSWGRINRALYCNDTHDYYEVRGLPVPVAVKLNKGGLPELGKPEHVRASLSLGHDMAMGWYELLASRKF